MKRWLLIAMIAATTVACNINTNPKPPTPPDRAFAVDVPARSGSIMVDGWDCPTHNPDWCGIWTPIQDKGTYGHVDYPALSGSAPAMNIHIRANGYEEMACVGSVPMGNATASFNLPLEGNRYHPDGCPDLTPLAPPSRRGLVRGQGKEVLDDTGSFHPLGITFFWAMQGWHGDRGRFQQNVQFLSKYGYDYVRILAQVNWDGNDINPDTWPDYEQTLGEVIDYFYANGMRVEITVLGSPYADPVGLAHRVARVVKPRVEKVIAFETWNEWNLNGGTLPAMSQMCQVLLQESGVSLVALSSNGGDDEIAAASNACGATLRTVHTDRGQGDNGWRMVRQAFDFKDLPGVVDSNEPPGPQSSVNTLSSPLQLALMRALGVAEGGAMFVLHVGDMVAGQRDPGHHRMPNLWQAGCETDDPAQANTPESPCPLIDQTLKVVRAIDKWLPSGVEDWRPKTPGNVQSQPQALKADQAGYDGVIGPTVNRAYAAISGLRFVQTLLGVRGNLGMTLTLPGAASCHITGENPETHESVDITLAAGQRWSVAGRDDTMTGFILNGDCQ